jgi:hypothetical protein
MRRREDHPRNKKGQYMKERENVQLVVRKYDTREPSFDYLKYMRVARLWIHKVHGLSLPDLEMLLFLRTERLFSRQDFDKYENIMSWDKGRFSRLLKDGWIVKWRTEGKDRNRYALYNVSPRGKKILASFYRKLSGDEDYSLDTRKNPVMKKSAGFSDKTLAMQMKKINEENRERRLTPVRLRKDRKR